MTVPIARTAAASGASLTGLALPEAPEVGCRARRTALCGDWFAPRFDGTGWFDWRPSRADWAAPTGKNKTKRISTQFVYYEPR